MGQHNLIALHTFSVISSELQTIHEVSVGLLPQHSSSTPLSDCPCCIDFGTLLLMLHTTLFGVCLLVPFPTLGSSLVHVCVVVSRYFIRVSSIVC